MKGGFWSGAALDRVGTGIHVSLSAFSEVLCWTLGKKQKLFNSKSQTVKRAIRMKMTEPKKGGRQPSATCLVLFCASERVRNKVPPRSEQSFET